jgi:hypothetical protein
MAKDNMFGKMEIFIKDNGKMVRNMEWGLFKVIKCFELSSKSSK